MTHWTKELKEQNKRLKDAVAYLQYQLRMIPQTRFDKYRNAKWTDMTMAYRKAVEEVDRLGQGAIDVSREIIYGETVWNSETNQYVD